MMANFSFSFFNEINMQDFVEIVYLETILGRERNNFKLTKSDGGFVWLDRLMQCESQYESQCEATQKDSHCR